MVKVNRPPAEKKRLSYERDGRNTYGQNNKASRRRIPAFKAASNRAMRHAVMQTLKAAPSSDIDLERADASIADKTYIGLHPSKRKAADEPLGAVLAKKRERAPTKVNAKNIRRAKREANKD